MEHELALKTGMTVYQIDNGTAQGASLMVNLSDPLLYQGFVALQGLLQKWGTACPPPEQLGVLDREVKEQLCAIFPPGNDFLSIFAGMSVFTMDEEGHTLLENFLQMLRPVAERAAQAAKLAQEKRICGLVGNREERRLKNQQAGV